jgi:3-deoxy-7-phosphoheptulonate synthase
MLYTTDVLRFGGLRPLIPPAILIEEIPVTETVSTTVWKGREEATAILAGRDDRLLVVVGPCSIHDPAAAIDYARRLRERQIALQEDLCVVMRVYFEKPRTTVGWKGLINDPNVDESFDINKGLHLARGLLRDLAEMGLPTGSEFLDTITPQFVTDLIGWGAIGARTTESQIHRELASGLSVPVGFKNGTDGNVQIAIDAIEAARRPHHFLSVTKQGLSAIVTTKGNDACHVILRGSTSGPNYEPAALTEAVGILEQAGLRGSVMIDCSHGNSNKDYRQQPAVCRAIAEQVAAGSRALFGLMIESNLVEGNQKLGDGPLTYGQSITDACVSWESTVPMLDELAAAVRTRRQLA